MAVQEIVSSNRNAYIMHDNLHPSDEVLIVFDVSTKSFVCSRGNVNHIKHPMIPHLMTSTTPFWIYEDSFICYSRLRIWYYDRTNLRFKSCPLLDEHSRSYFDDSPMTVLIQWESVFAYQKRNVLLIRYKNYVTDTFFNLESAIVIFPDHFRFTNIFTTSMRTFITVTNTITNEKLVTTICRYSARNTRFHHDTHNANHQPMDIGLRIV